jgi:cytochrome c peroxidase
MRKVLFILSIALIALWGCSQAPQKGGETATKPATADQFQGLADMAKSTFGVLPAVAENPNNPITPEKVLLGQTLYFDKRLSKKENIACNSCHELNAYGVDNSPTSPGDDGVFGDRNSPTTLNAAFHFAQFWDGRAKDVEEQAGGPILNPIEMGMPDREFVITKISKIDGYKKMFEAAYPGEKNLFTYENVQKSIAAFERKLVTPSKLDAYINGDDKALTDQEKKGLQTFMGAGCTACHSGVVLGGTMFQKFGLMSNYWDLTRSKKVDDGRFKVTKNDADKYIFKVPSLRNIEKTSPYFHDGSVASLDEAVKIIAKTQLNKDLSGQEINEIITFLKTLTGTVPPELAEMPEMPK